MDQIPLHEFAVAVAAETGFVIDKEIYRGTYYSADLIRDIIYFGIFEGKRAVLKVYDDPRLVNEPENQIAFNKFNKSSVLVAPEVFAFKMLSPHKGWMIMEQLPEGGVSFKQPTDDKKLFAELFIEYRRNFPLEPTRPLNLVEQLPADERHVQGISRWLELATDKEAERAAVGQPPLLPADEFLPRLEKTLALLRDTFKNRQMIWCHGHFKPHEVFKAPGDSPYYLTDFAHTTMFPETYELAFIVWADCLVSGDWRIPYPEWKKGIEEWLSVLDPVAKQLEIADSERVLRANLAQRCIAAIMADITAGDRARGEQEGRIKLLYQLLDDILNGKL